MDAPLVFFKGVVSGKLGGAVGLKLLKHHIRHLKALLGQLPPHLLFKAGDILLFDAAGLLHLLGQLIVVHCHIGADIEQNLILSLQEPQHLGEGVDVHGHLHELTGLACIGLLLPQLVDGSVDLTDALVAVYGGHL